MRRGLLLGGVALLSVGFVVWGFAGSSFSTGAAVVGALGAALLGLAVSFRVRRGSPGRGVAAFVGTQALYLALWIAGGLLWAGPPRELPHFASPIRLSLRELQGRWTRENGQMYEVRGNGLCPAAEAEPSACSHLEEDERGRVSWLMDDLWLPTGAYRRWGRESLILEPWSWTFSRPVPGR
ncbi:hypothetical protein QOL99_12310 [Deinococcus sp. MIMF12]|uniref:DUF4131 domain-containing protein n=1 Tax=Deinococcus rhizophilus TaxID=3049544 RepID=A0ABT7JKE6_9DEIO|nr:hypothetical protein [Deinococcus rhizophilus]MDL2344928.1 hypothetical protein [Deinococcus rhizophilus]